MRALSFSLILFSGVSLFAEPVCPKCEVIREYNKQHPGGEYEFYEDYLKAQKEKEDTSKKDNEEKISPK